MALFESLLGIGANLLGGLFNNNKQEQINQQNIQAQQAINAQNIALQKEFAQHGIQWKVDDAKAAGLHPLAALGANTASFSPLSAGEPAKAGAGPDFSALGQDLQRAAKALSTEEQRKAADAEKERKLDLESKALDNDIKRSTLGSRILSTSRAGGQLGPPMPSPDLPQGWAGMVGGSRAPFRVNDIAAADDEVKIKETSSPSVKKMKLWGVYPMEMHPDVASGQDLENEFGEVGGSAMSLPNIPAHFIYDAYKNKWPAIRNKWGKSHGSPRVFPYF